MDFEGSFSCSPVRECGGLQGYVKDQQEIRMSDDDWQNPGAKAGPSQHTEVPCGYELTQAIHTQGNCRDESLIEVQQRAPKNSLARHRRINSAVLVVFIIMKATRCNSDQKRERHFRINN